MKENGNEPDIIFMCISFCVSSCSFLSSNHEHHHISEIDHLVEMDEVLPQIKKGLEEKLEAMVRRELYTKYKTAPTEEEREKARQEYLNKVGMHSDFRW